MIKWVCSICGYTFEGPNPPERCPQCNAPASKFNKVEEGSMSWAAEHQVGIIDGVDAEIVQGTARKLYRRMHRSRHVSGYEPPGRQGRISRGCRSV